MVLQRMIGAELFNAHTYEEIEADQSALGQAIGVVILVANCGAIGELVEGFWRTQRPRQSSLECAMAWPLVSSAGPCG